MPYQKAAPISVAVPPTMGGLLGAPVLPGGALTSSTGEQEYSQLETSLIQAVCGLTDARWYTNLPEIYTRMLEEGRTTARVGALLKDTFCPDDQFSKIRSAIASLLAWS
jgi:hypothetical protein